MTDIVSLPLSAFTPPESHEELDAWLAEREQDLADLMAAEMGRILGEALERYAAGLTTVTAAADPAALDGVQERWRHFINEDVGDFIGGMYLAGNLGAVMTAGDALPVDLPDVVNANALDYQKLATNRLAQSSDLLWGEVNTKVLLGLNDGMSNDKIAREIADITSFGSNRAMTIARTETVSAYNGGDLDGALALGDLGPVAKQWLATGDARTRPDHVEANGQIVGLKDKFSVGGVSMDRPHDPSAPADQVVQCRCVMLMLYADDEALKGTQWEGAALTLDPSNRVIDPATVAPLSFRDQIAELRGRLVKGKERGKKPSKRLLANQEVINEIGARVDGEVMARLAARGQRRGIDARREIMDFDNRGITLYKDAERNYLDSSGTTADEWARIGLGNKQQILRATHPEYDEWIKDSATIERRLLQNIVSDQDFATAYSSTLQEVLAEIRPMGRPPKGGKKLSTVVQGQPELYERASGFYPSDWVKLSERGKGEFGDLEPGNNRGYHQKLYSATGTNPTHNYRIHIPRGRNDDIGLLVHELGHRMDYVHPSLAENHWAFLTRRAKGAEPRPMAELTGNRNYGDNEWGVPGFAQPYAGKVYGQMLRRGSLADGPNTSSELFTVGYESIVRGDLWIHDDREYLTYIVGVVSGL